MARVVSLGWDVGGYSNKGKKNAFAVATDTTDTDGEISLQIYSHTEMDMDASKGFYDFPKPLFLDAKKIIIAIDAPFGFPSALWSAIRDKTQIGVPNLSNRENQYAFRETDLEIMHLYDKTPLSPVFEKMGRNTLRAIFQLRRWKREYDELNVLPWVKVIDGRYTAIEVYPGLLNAEKKSFYNGFIERYEPVLKDAKVLASEQGTLLSSFKDIYGPKRKTSKADVHDNDKVDAAICALMGLEFERNKSNLADLSKLNLSQQEEGIIYRPSFQS